MERGVQFPVILGGLAGACGVALSAYGMHADSKNIMIAAQFLLFHAPVLVSLEVLATNRLLQISLLLFTLGLCLFCGDLVIRSMSGDRLFAMAAPLGGITLILAWLLLALSGFFRSRPEH